MTLTDLIIRGAVWLARKAFTETKEKKPKPAPKPAPVLPAEARGHVLSEVLVHGRPSNKFFCPRCAKVGTRRELADQPCVDLGL